MCRDYCCDERKNELVVMIMEDVCTCVLLYSRPLVNRPIVSTRTFKRSYSIRRPRAKNERYTRRKNDSREYIIVYHRIWGEVNDEVYIRLRRGNYALYVGGGCEMYSPRRTKFQRRVLR